MNLKSIKVTVVPHYTVFPGKITYQASVTVESGGQQSGQNVLLVDDDFAASRFEQMMKEATREVLARMRDEQ